MSVLSTLSLGALCLQLGMTTLVATDVIRAGDRISSANSEAEGGIVSDRDETMLGREVRRTVYAGQPIEESNTRAPRLVVRNQAVTVRYVAGSLEITMMGRAMADGSVGDVVSVMNPQSRELVHGTVTEQGWILAQ